MTTPLRCEKGALTVEFALTACLFILILAMCLEVSRVQIASMLLERSVYDIAHQVRAARGQNFEAIAQTVVQARSQGMFRAEEVHVRAASGPDMESVAAGGTPGAGSPGDIVHLTLTASLGIFSAFVPSPLRATRVIDYYFQNEPGMLRTGS
jgi:hypothetical protein